jgi:hypothetical protein
MVSEIPNRIRSATKEFEEIRCRYASTDDLKDLQLDALAAAIAPPIRADYLQQLSWMVVRFPPKSLILGDIAVLRFLPSTGKYDLALDRAEDQYLILPLSDGEMLVGHPGSTMQAIDADSVNRAMAGLSFEFFVAAQNTNREQSYQKQIGERLDSVWQQALSSL